MRAPLEVEKAIEKKKAISEFPKSVKALFRHDINH
jgi:hypothetical protein